MKLLKFLYILQEVSNKGRKTLLGRGYTTAIRYNPYNPLSYIVIVITLVRRSNNVWCCWCLERDEFK